MAKDFMLLFIEYLNCFTVKYFIQLTHSDADMYMCTRVICIRVCVHGLIDMRIYGFVSTSACSPFLSDILTRPQYFFISCTLLIVLWYCHILWCCTFVTGQPLTLIKMMNSKVIIKNNSCPGICIWNRQHMMAQPLQAHRHGKYDSNGKGWYLRFDDDNRMRDKYMICYKLHYLISKRLCHIFCQLPLWLYSWRTGKLYANGLFDMFYVHRKNYTGYYCMICCWSRYNTHGITGIRQNASHICLIQMARILLEFITSLI